MPAIQPALSVTTDLAPLPISAAEIKAARRRGATRGKPVDFSATVVGQVARRGAQAPDQVVVVSKNGTTTYQELACRVAVIRRALLAAGCVPGCVVAALGPRSAETIAIFLATESLGCVYLPLDPGWPAARMTAVLDSSRPGCVVEYLSGPEPSAARDAVVAAGKATGTQVLRIDAGEWPADEPDPAQALREIDRPSCADSSEPRYLYYTSGTTGEPRGALIEHRGMVNHLWAKITDLELGAGDALGFTAPLGFDIAVCQMLMPLLVGATIAVIDDHDVRSPRRLTAELARHAVTVVELVPTIIGWLLRGIEQARGASVPPLRLVVSTGEELRPALARQVFEVLPSARLMNSYGFTECSDDIAHHAVTEQDLEAGRLPVGSPIINAALYVLVRMGSSWRSAAPGERGELFIGGVPVGRGYVRNPEATKAAYFLDPIDPLSQTGRLYKTGDLAVLQDSGILHYHGRTGRQVKLSGTRVEPDEIEAVLGRHPDVTACAVMTAQVSGQTELAAYFVTAGEKPHLENDLRRYLLRQLPAPMVPSRWFQVDTMPLSVNGKINYNALKGNQYG
jgi:amino acid adenylation domain-containing protein